jgi:hypothetical protein
MMKVSNLARQTGSPEYAAARTALDFLPPRFSSTNLVSTTVNQTERVAAAHSFQVTMGLDLIEAKLVAPAIVELRRAHRGMVRHSAVVSNFPPFRK